MWTVGTSCSRFSGQVSAKNKQFQAEKRVGAPVRAEGSSSWWALHGSKTLQAQGLTHWATLAQVLGTVTNHRKQQNKQYVSATPEFIY